MTVNNNESGKHGYSLFEILVYIWRGKYFIGAFVAIGMILSIIAYSLSARIYVSTAVVRVGKIANVQLESEVMIRNSVLSEANLFDPAVNSV
ncbi:MAG TPA: Wzz/FepE/Etk N-terminal domain-containing protein, partial [Spirochaetota bacterium]|nr:Wzz/FepE/Etk N-terminal domain-containing protein [Spirochaetota bacterium]